MVLEYRDRVLAFVKINGPVLPVQIGKEMKTDTLLASAMLSELSSKGSLKISSLKVGGSPLYYLPGQEGMLIKFINGLSEKDRGTLEKLQQGKVLRDNEQDALTRFSLRTLKDFASPLNVTHDGQTEIFWKWHQVPDADASNHIRGLLTPVPPPQPPVQQVTQPKPPVQAPVSAPRQQIQEPPAEVHPVRDRRKKPRAKKAKPKISAPVDPLPEITPPAAEQKVLADPSLADPFFKQLQTFLDKSNIKILEHRMLKKRQEFDLVLQIPSPVGWLVYYAKARNKQRLGDADLNAAFVQGQLKKLPAMLIAPGELTKKGQELLSKDLQGLAFTRIS